MWRQLVLNAGRRYSSSCRDRSAVSSAVDSLLLRSLKDHYLEVSKMTPPPKVSPPSPFSIIKGSLDKDGPVLRRSYGDEDITVSVMRLANIIPGAAADDLDEDDGSINQLFLHVDISKPDRQQHLHFLCALYPDAMGIHSISLRPIPGSLSSHFISLHSKYHGPAFQDLEEKTRDAFHEFMEERGLNEGLFPFLQAWLYVKDHRNLMRWFKTVGTFINKHKAV